MRKKIRPIHVLELMTVLFMAAILFAVVVQVLSRYLLATIPMWTGEEAVTFLMIWMVNMGASVSMGYNSHIVVDALVNVMPPRIKLFMNRLAYLIMTLFLGYFSISGFLYVWGNRRLSTPRLRIPTLLQQGSIPLGAAVMCAFALYYLLLTFRKGQEAPKGDAPS